MNATYRYAPVNLWIAWACVVVAPFWFGGFLVGVWYAKNISNALTLGLCSLIPLMLGIGSIWAVWTLRRHRLVMTDAHVEMYEKNTCCKMAFTDIRLARWESKRPKIQLCLESPNGKIVIRFSSYNLPTQHALIRFFRFRLPEDRQQGWEDFWRQTWTWFDMPDKSNPETYAKSKRSANRSANRLFAVVAALWIEALVLSWWVGFSSWIDVAKFILFLPCYWLLLRWCMPQCGKYQSKVVYSRLSNLPGILGLIFVVIGLPCYGLFCKWFLGSLEEGMPQDPMWLLVIPVGLFVVTLLSAWSAIWHERQKKRQWESLRKLAEEEYMRPLEPV